MKIGPAGRVDEVLHNLRAHPDGIGVVQLAGLMRWNRKTLANALQAGREQGRLMFVGAAGFGRWVAPENAERALATIERQAAERASLRLLLQRQKRKRQNCAQKWRRMGLLKDGREPPDMPVVHVIVSANDAPPIRKLGPASVWELAA